MVTPRLKRPNLAPDVMKNYRPISQLPFVSKILEKVVLKQLLLFLNGNSIVETSKSGFKAAHSTESALFKVLNYIFLTLDKGDAAILVLLDLSAAYMIDHIILISHLEHIVGLKDTVLKWFKSFISDKYLSVNYGNSTSTKKRILWGVPQGSN